MPIAPSAPANTGGNAAVELARLRKELAEANAKLAAKPAPKITLKVSEKGGVSVYGLGRFPVTLYKEQWTAVLAKAPDITAFMAANASKLKSKED